MTEEKEKIIARLYCKLKHELRVYAARYCPDEAEDIVHQNNGTIFYIIHD